jgi:hypothetical protein
VSSPEQDPQQDTVVMLKLMISFLSRFLWVQLQLDNLCRQRSDGDIKEQLRSLPQGLNETYLRIVHQLDQQPKALRRLAKRSLTWVFYAARPLRMHELIDAVAIADTCKKQGDLKRYKGDVIIEACANLLVQEDGCTTDSLFCEGVFHLPSRKCG